MYRFYSSVFFSAVAQNFFLYSGHEDVGKCHCHFRAHHDTVCLNVISLIYWKELSISSSVCLR